MTANSSGSVENEVADRLWHRRYGVLHRVQLAVRYHNKRERFFDGLDRGITALTALAATGAVATLLQKATATGTPAGPGLIELTLAAISAALSAFAVAYSPGAKARLHAQLASDFRKVWADCVGTGEQWEERHCDGFEAKALQAEVGEPPALGALVVQCENEIAIAEGQPERVRVLNWCQRWFKQVWNFDTTACPYIDREKAEGLRPPASRARPADGAEVTSA